MIRPEGWDSWDKELDKKTVYYGEYQLHGPGANPPGRVAWAHHLTAKESKGYSLKAIFAAQGPWVPAR